MLGNPVHREITKNPLSFEERKFLLEKYFIGENRLKIGNIIDCPESNYRWNLSVKNNIDYYFPKTEKIKMYYGEKIDKALGAVQEWKDLYEYIDFIENPRAESFVNINEENIPISASNFRKFLIEKDYENAKKFTDESIFDDIVRVFENIHNSSKP